MPTVVIFDPASKRRRRSKIYGVRTFMDPGCPTDFAGAFRDNVRRFVRECADVEERAALGMPTWSTMLVDEKSGAVVPLYTVEECVRRSPPTFCDHCRRNEWLCIRMEPPFCIEEKIPHNLIPADDECDKAPQLRLLPPPQQPPPRLVHCNGFGHLLLINGREGGSHFLSGRTLMTSGTASAPLSASGNTLKFPSILKPSCASSTNRVLDVPGR
ncbi:PHD finger protein MALE MEIOCYTE DEATH 1-like isoform X1 [Asparagus officinalis]|uniref:PHD finger protein MALE MEIOCYTE DEATH 1-like isoform X1 n=1 Tax=Asparagus officinalis TaxID=4686 RepID=UPI00098E6D2A|nr:PHD finger protein MALE MEIOCYTE DEATH 1-like isoform X1 [Asparagus officinalis]